MSGLRIFQNREFGAVRVIEHKGEPWFVARDVCAVLGTETRDLPDILEHDEQRPIVDIIHTLNDSTGLRRDSRIISEPGLYSLVLRSRKPEAKAFKRWIVHEVIPSIRRTGGYGALALPNFRNPAEAARAWADKEEQRLLEEQKRLALEQRMEEVKPNLIICVPLILEKIYRKQILPMLNKRTMRWALSLPVLDSRIYGQVCKKLVDAFGGRFEQVIVGGAPLNAEVEAFLHKIKFPFTVGYGMTECAPLISYTHWKEFIPRSSGRILPGYMEVKIDSTDPQLIPGEICVRGENVMKGYYKNEEATADVLKDGWLHTGDMGTVSEDGTIFIKGRYKTMILGANGQNIYPEEIESKLNNMPFVMESLVIEKEGKLVALVYPDFEAVDTYGLTPEDLPVAMEEVRRNLNKEVAPYESIAHIYIYQSEFEKTPKRSIKRYLYTNFTPLPDKKEK